MASKLTAESTVAYHPFWALRPCLAFTFKIPELESFDVMESGEQGAVECCLQCGTEAGCASWVFARSSCSLHVGMFPIALLSHSSSIVAGVMHSAAKLSQLISPMPREPGLLQVSSASQSARNGWVGIPLHDECWERTQRAELLLRLKGETPWTDLRAWHTRLGTLRSLDTKSWDPPLEHSRPNVMCDRIAMCQVGSALARGLYKLASTTVDALAARRNVSSLCFGAQKMQPSAVRISPSMKSFGWRMLGIYTHNSIQDLVTTMRDAIGLNITFIGMGSVPNGGCITNPGSCLKQLSPFWSLQSFEEDGGVTWASLADWFLARAYCTARRFAGANCGHVPLCSSSDLLRVLHGIAQVRMAAVAGTLSVPSRAPRYPRLFSHCRRCAGQ